MNNDAVIQYEAIWLNRPHKRKCVSTELLNECEPNWIGR